jgi:thiol-disulfide isomerase/thioredoxin
MGYLFYKASKLWRIFILAFSLISCIFIHFKGGDLWLHKLNFGTFTGKINVAATPDFQFTNEQGNCLSLNDFAGKYVVTDFWFTGCGVCFRKFPQVQYLYDEYKENPAIAVISINAKLKDEAGNLAFETIAKKGYSFPVYRLDMDNPILKEMKIDGYPTVLIFDKGGNIIFRGSIENASNYIKKIEAAAGY